MPVNQDEDKRRQAAVDKRGSYTDDDVEYIYRTGNNKDKARWQSAYDSIQKKKKKKLPPSKLGSTVADALIKSEEDD